MKRKLVCEIDELNGSDSDFSPKAKMSSNAPGGSANTWLNILRSAKKSCSCSNGVRRIHYEMSDGGEMLEEYNTATSCLSRRAWKKTRSPLGGPSEWTVEIGEPPPPGALDADGLREANDQPIITRRNTRNNLEWRIRNLPYPIEVYSVAASASDKCIIVKTTNKKYYKKLNVPEIERVGLIPMQPNIEFSHKFNTLIITYKKPPELIKMEKMWLEELNKIENEDNPVDDCKTS